MDNAKGVRETHTYPSPNSIRIETRPLSGVSNGKRAAREMRPLTEQGRDMRSERQIARKVLSDSKDERGRYLAVAVVPGRAR